MKNIYMLLLVSLIYSSCAKNKVAIDKVIFDLKLSSKVAFADGSSKIVISVKVDKNASVDKRMIIFRSSDGSLANGTNGSVSVKAEFEKDSLIAKAVLTVPNSATEIYITAMPDIPNKENYTLYDTLKVNKSTPFSLKLNPSSFGLKANYLSEDTITALVLNEKGKKVSIGTKVIFEDLLPNLSSANGKFRNVKLTTDNNALVSAIYSTGTKPIGSIIQIKATVVDEKDIKTSITDAIILTIIP